MYKVNIFVMYTTLLVLEKKRYRLYDSILKSSSVVSLEEFNKFIDATRKYDIKDLKDLVRRDGKNCTIVSVEQRDCLDVAFDLKKNNSYQVAVLNMANAVSPNGGWDLGHWAQVI